MGKHQTGRTSAASFPACSLSRNLGLITGASLMGALFAAAVETRGRTLTGQAVMGVAHASPDAIAGGVQASFRAAAAMGLAALALAALTPVRAPGRKDSPR